MPKYVGGVLLLKVYRYRGEVFCHEGKREIFYENIFLRSVLKRGDSVIRTIQWALTIKAMAGLKNGKWFQSAPRVVWGDHVKILAQAFV